MFKNYTFFFKDGYFVTFSLTENDFLHVKNTIMNKLEVVLLDEYVIMLSDLRYVAKQKETQEPESAVPEYLEQDVYEYLKSLERGLRNGEETGY